MDSTFFSVFTELPPSLTGVTRDEFYSFYRIDRTLFSRYVFDLNRDTHQTSQTIAFFFSLEQNEYARNLTPFLAALPDAFIESVANEADVCLSILHNQDFSRFFVGDSKNDDDGSVIPLLLRLTGGRLTLRVINQNRDTFLLSLRKNMNDVCSRAFDDLTAKAEMWYQQKMLMLEREKVIEEMMNMRLSAQQGTSSSRLLVPQGIPNRVRAQQQQTPVRLSATQETPNMLGNPNKLSAPQETPNGLGNPNRLSVQQERAPAPATTTPRLVEEEKNKTVVAEAEKEAVLPDDRTVFLTFSKGYPISESEVRVFFTRRFGEVIEAILMQEVEENEQPLWAKMVLKMQCVSKIEEIVSPAYKQKFTINGKHVWARKYVRKGLGSSASPSSSYV